MEWLWWIIFVLMLFLGFLGTLLPAMPGIVLFPLATVMIYYLIPGVFSIWTVVIMALGFAFTFALDLAGTLIGAKWGGATKWGLAGAAIGGVIGLFFALPGILLGPLFGAFIAEYLFKRRNLKESARSGIGAGAGLFISTGAKLALAVALLLVLIIDIFLIV